MKKELLDAQRRMQNTVEDIDQWSPHNPQINAFDTSSLEQLYGQSFSTLQLGQAVYSAAMDQMQGLVDDFRGKLGLLQSDAYEYERQLASDDGQTRAQASYALERNLTARAQQGEATGEGSEIAKKQSMLNELGDQDAMLAGQAGAMAGQEDLSKLTQHYNNLTSNNQSMINALMGQAGTSQAMGSLSRQLGAQSLDAMGKAAQHGIANKMQLMNMYKEHSGMQSTALQERLGSAVGMAGARGRAYVTDEKSKMEADRIKRGQTTKKIGGIIGAAGGVASWLTGGKTKGKGGKSEKN